MIEQITPHSLFGLKVSYFRAPWLSTYSWKSATRVRGAALSARRSSHVVTKNAPVRGSLVRKLLCWETRYFLLTWDMSHSWEASKFKEPLTLGKNASRASHDLRNTSFRLSQKTYAPRANSRHRSISIKPVYKRVIRCHCCTDWTAPRSPLRIETKLLSHLLRTPLARVALAYADCYA